MNMNIFYLQKTKKKLETSVETQNFQWNIVVVFRIENVKYQLYTKGSQWRLTVDNEAIRKVNANDRYTSVNP